MKSLIFPIIAVLLHCHVIFGDTCSQKLRDLDLVKKAREFAVQAHGSQPYGDAPYSKHLDAVVDVIHRFGFSDPNNAEHIKIVLSAWLHDTIEDTSVSKDDINHAFGPEVADIVYRVTDEPGSTRKERKLKTYPKIKGHTEATIVKLADRIANVEESIRSKSVEHFEKYQAEQKGFKDAVYVSGIADPMWEHLEKILNTKI